MSGKTVVRLAMVLALALTGCSGRSNQQAAAPSPSGSTTTAAASPSAAAKREICQAVDTAAYNQLLAEALAVGDKKKNGSALRADVAQTYRNFAVRLSLIAPGAPGNLRPALTEWASAGTAVARFVAGNTPRPGIVIDYGPTQKRWDAAQKAAEKICGHKLPNLDK